MTTVMPYVLWSAEYCPPVWNKGLTKCHRVLLLIQAKANIFWTYLVLHVNIGGRKNHNMKVYKMLSLRSLIPNEVKLGIAARRAVETISQLASLRS